MTPKKTRISTDTFMLQQTYEFLVLVVVLSTLRGKPARISTWMRKCHCHSLVIDRDVLHDESKMF